MNAPACPRTSGLRRLEPWQEAYGSGVPGDVKERAVRDGRGNPRRARVREDGHVTGGQKPSSPHPSDWEGRFKLCFTAGR